MDRPLEPAEALIYDRLRPEVEEQVRAELAPVYDERSVAARDRAARALVITVSVSLALGLPIAALGAGAAVRLFLWSAGFRGLY